MSNGRKKLITGAQRPVMTITSQCVPKYGGGGGEWKGGKRPVGSNSKLGNK